MLSMYNCNCISTYRKHMYSSCITSSTSTHTQIGSADGEIGLKIKFISQKIFAAGTTDSMDYSVSVLCHASVLSLLVVVAG